MAYQTNTGFISDLVTSGHAHLQDGSNHVIHTGIIKALNIADAGSFVAHGMNIDSLASGKFNISAGGYFRNGDYVAFTELTGGTAATPPNTWTGDANYDWYGLICIADGSESGESDGDVVFRKPAGTLSAIKVADPKSGDIPIAVVQVLKSSSNNYATAKKFQFLGINKVKSSLSIGQDDGSNGTYDEKLKINTDGTVELTGNSGKISFPTVGSTNSTLYSTNDKGISNGNVLVANANVADNDFLKVDGTSIEGRTAAEVKSDLSIALTDVSGDLDDIADGTDYKKYPNADKTKVGHLTVTGAQNLDTIGTKVGYLTITGAVNLDTAQLTDTQLTNAQVNAAIDTNVIAEKSYVDTVKRGLDTKDSVRVATTANLDLSGTETIDGISVVADNRVLVKNQTDASENGIYLCKSGSWVRTEDANADAEVTSGMYVWVEEGTANGDTGWILTTTGSITVGTTDLAFSQFSGSATQLTGGAGLTKTGTELSLTPIADGKILGNTSGNSAAPTEITTPMISLITAANAGASRTAIGATNLGSALLTATNLGNSETKYLKLTTDGSGNHTITARTDTQIRGDIGAGTSSFSGAFGDLTSKPTTISGYGITDSFSGDYVDLSNKPTTITSAQATAISDNTTRSKFAESSVTDLGTAGDIDNDLIAIYDVTASAYKKVKMKDFLTKITANQLVSSGSGTGTVFTTLPASGATVGGILGSGGNILLEDGSTKATDATVLNANTTKADVGLGSVDNTADTAKPVSTAQQTALDAKVPTTRTIAGRALSNNLVVRVNASTGKLEVNDGSNTTTIQDTAGTPVDVIFDNRKTEWAEIQDGSSNKPANNATVGAVLGTNLKAADGSTTLGDADVKNASIASSHVVGSGKLWAGTLPEDGATKGKTFRQDGIPTSTNAGDLWVDTNDNNKIYQAGVAGADQITSGEWELLGYAAAEANATANTGDVAKTGTINANEYARWSDATTLEARTPAEVRSDLGIADNEIIDWTASSAGTIHSSNYTDTTYSSFAGSTSTAGLVPVRDAGATTTKYLREDGDWVVPPDTTTNTQNTYTSSWVDSTNDVLLRLTAGGASSGTQDIKLVAGSNVSLTPSGTDMTIASTDTTYSVMASGNSYAAGLVPAGASSHGSLFLRKDGTWADPDTDTNDYVNSLAFNTGDGVLTLGRTGSLADLTVDLDGRYVTTGSSGEANQTITTGTGLDGADSGETGNITIDLDLSELTDMTESWTTGEDEFIVLDNGTQKRKLSSEIFGSNAFNSTTIPTNNNQLTNGAAYITSQRAIHDTPVDGATTTSISSNWAYDNVKTAVPANAVFTDTVYTHPNSVVTNIDTANAEVIDTIETNSTGHITAMTKRTMTLAQLGYTGETDATADQTAAEIAALALTGYSTAGSASAVVATDSIKDAFGKLEYRVNLNDAKVTNTDADVSVANLKTRLASLTGDDTVYIGDSGDDTTVVVRGTLQVDGTTTTVNSTTVNLDDHNIVLDSGNSTSAVVDGAGFTLEGGSGDDVTLQWLASGTKMELKKGSSYANLKAGTIEGSFTGDLTGNADTVTTNANLTGDITSSGNATSIASGVIVNADVNASAAIAYSKLNLTGAVLNADLAGSIANDKLANSAITIAGSSTSLGGSITADTIAGQISSGTITNAQLAGSIAGSKLATGAVDTTQLATDAVTNAKIAAEAVDTTELATDAVQSDKIDSDAVTTAKIADSAVTGAKVSAFTISDVATTGVLYQNAGESGNILVNSHNGFPTTPAVVKVGSEFIKYKSLNGDGRTLDGCIRGYRGTTAASHNANATVTVLAGKDITLGGSKDIEVLPFVGADSSDASTPGLVPKAETGDAALFLRGDGAWASASTSGMTSFTLTGDSGTNQSIADGDTLDIAGGTGISTTVGATDTVTIAVSGAQTGITTDYNTARVIGRDADNNIDFTTDNEIHFKTNGETPVIKMKASGEVEATSLDISGDADIDGTLEADAITIGGTAIGSIYSPVAGHSSIATVGTITTGTWNGTAIASGYIAADAITGAKIADDSIDSEHIAAGAIDLEHLSSESVDEDNLYISNAGSDGQFLQKQSGNNGGLTWATVSSGDSNAGGVDGSAGAPTFSFASDTNTGMFRLTGDTLGFSVGGTAAMYMQSSKVEANKRFEIIAGSNTAPGLSLAGDDNTGIYRYAENQIGFTIDGTAQLFIKDGAIEPVTDNDIDLGTSSKEFKDGYFDGTLHCDVLDLAGTEYTSIGGATDIDGLSDGKSGGTDFTGSLLLGHQSHGTLSSAVYNTGVGISALDALTSGTNNTALGWSAGSAITEATDGVYIGKQAGVDITTNSRVVSVGSSAGKNAGFGTTSVGFWAGIWTQATNGVNIGYGAGARGTANATKNVFIGDMPTYGGDGTFEGDYNVAIGDSAMYAINGSANYNIGIGRQTLYTLDDGSDYNTAIGYQAGYAITTGDKNILIGTQSGDNITSGDNNVIIGSIDADSATADDQLIIASGDGGVTWIKGDSNGNVLLNQLADVVSVSGNTTLTQAQSGSYVYWTSGTLTLPADAAVGTQFTIFNNTGSSATVALGSGDAMASNWASNAAVADNDATAYVCVNISSSESQWVQVGA